MLRKDETVESFTKVLNHVVSLWFAMNEKVKPNLLLETDDFFNLLFDELVILSISDLALAELGTSITDLLGLLLGKSSERHHPSGGR